MYYRYVEELASITSEMFNQMSDVKIHGYEIKPDQRTMTRYSLALFIPYGHLNGEVKGNFLLGFNEEEMALLVASAIGRKMGIPRMTMLDQNARDVLTEFMNVVMGRTMAGWEQMGFDVVFDPPRIEVDSTIRSLTGMYSSNWIVKLHLGISTLDFGVSFYEVTRFDPNDLDVMIIDPTELTRGILVNEMVKRGFNVNHGSGLGIVSDQINEHPPDLFVIDADLPDNEILDMVVVIRDNWPASRVLLLGSDEQMLNRIDGENAFVSIIIKPVQTERIIDTIRAAFARQPQ